MIRIERVACSIGAANMEPLDALTTAASASLLPMRLVVVQRAKGPHIVQRQRQLGMLPARPYVIGTGCTWRPDIAAADDTAPAVTFMGDALKAAPGCRIVKGIGTLHRLAAAYARPIIRTHESAD